MLLYVSFRFLDHHSTATLQIWFPPYAALSIGYLTRIDIGVVILFGPESANVRLYRLFDFKS